MSEFITPIEDVWKIVDDVIEQNRDKTSEAIETMAGEYNSVHISYSRIKDNRLVRKEFDVSMRLLNNLHEDTIRLIIGELLFTYFREE